MEHVRPISVVRFGTYEVSFQAGELRKSGLRIRVQQQPMKLLEMLLEHPGEVVTREELRGRVWPNESFGDFDQALSIAIAKLRSALGDSADNPQIHRDPTQTWLSLYCGCVGPRCRRPPKEA
jgi:DNA-binding winged helix-turn-helix (wHTH) protein